MDRLDDRTNVVDDASNKSDDGRSISPSVVDGLIARAKSLLSEIEAFRDRLRSLRQEGTVETGHFRGTVQSELTMLERLSQKPESKSTDHIARSSNLPFLEHVWSMAKRSKDLVALQKRLYLDAGVKSLSQGMHHIDLRKERRTEKGSKENAVIIDTITDQGRTWTKVSLTTHTRLLFDLAKQGWDSGSSENDDGDFVFSAGNSDDDGDVPLLKTVKELTRASKLFRVRTRHPSVHIVLPRIQFGETTEIDDILNDCRSCGAVVFCGQDLQPLPTLESALQRMARDPFLSFSDNLNIDCTILLALVSEFSHSKVSKEAWFHKALQRQVEIEGNENLLPSLLYPAMGSHKLVCTQEAAKRMREIVDTIGTPSEKARTAILMGDDDSKTQMELVEEMQLWSAYTVPTSWQLPLMVVDQNQDDCQSRLPDVSKAVSTDLTEINRSVFLYGWARRLTTITSNRTVVKQLENGLEQFEDLDDEAWPSVWLCPTARSLVGKEKRGIAKKDRVMQLQDSLHREHQMRNGLDLLSLKEGCQVEDLQPNRAPCEEVIAAKNASQRDYSAGSAP